MPVSLYFYNDIGDKRPWRHVRYKVLTAPTEALSSRTRHAVLREEMWVEVEGD